MKFSIILLVYNELGILHELPAKIQLVRDTIVWIILASDSAHDTSVAIH